LHRVNFRNENCCGQILKYWRRAEYLCIHFLMKVAAISVNIVLALGFTACRAPGGPLQRAGRTVDHTVYKVGGGVQRTGQSIENTATGN
jgi:hypothetical protein